MAVNEMIVEALHLAEGEREQRIERQEAETGRGVGGERSD
jgi:hypothetical protein